MSGEEKTLKKYGQGIVFDWTGANVERRIFDSTEEYAFTVPANAVHSEPIRIFLKQKNANSRMRISVDVGRNSKVSFLQNMQLAEFCELTVNLKVAEGAKVEYAIVQNTHENGYLRSAYRGQVGKGATLTWFDLELGGRIVSADIETSLAGSGAIGNTFGVLLGQGMQAFDISHRTNHRADRTSSRMESKGALYDSAKAVYRGLIHIPKGIFGSTGFERSDTLLLSKQAQAVSIPELEIGNNDVQCGHASTISRIDTEKMFYFQSRGISADEAAGECARGHVMSILEKLEHTAVRSELKECIERRLQG